MTAPAAIDERPAEETRPADEKREESLVRSPAAEIGFGLSAENWDAGFRIAKVLAASQLVPKDYRGRPEDVVVAMQYGAEVGLPPMAALQSVAVINGKPGLYGDGFLGVIMASPRYRKHVEFYVNAKGERVDDLTEEDYEANTSKAVSMFWRKGIEEPFVGTFSIFDAKKAKLWNKEGPWTNYPARQMKWRARGFGGRDGFAAELRGIKMAEELRDEEDDLARTAAFTVSDAAPPPIVRRSEKAPQPTIEATATPAADPGSGMQDHPALRNELPPEPAKAPPASRSGSRPAPPKPTKSQPPPPPQRPTPAAKPAADVMQKLESVVITDTAYLTPKDTPAYYEIRARVEKPGEAPVGYIFATDDEQLYQLAMSCEGTTQLFAVTWQPDPSGRGRKILRTLSAN